MHRKFGSDTETQQRKHKYKQDTIQNTTIKSITVVDTWYWSINKILLSLFMLLPDLVNKDEYIRWETVKSKIQV